MTVLSFIYQYILHPFKTIQLYGSQAVRLRTSYLVIALLTFLGVQPHDEGFLLSWLSLFLLLCGCVLFQSVGIDVVAQLFGKKGRMTTTFRWLCLTYIPILLHPSIRMLLGETIFIGVVSIILFIFVMLLQYKTIRRIYRTGKGVSVLLVAIPFSVPVLFGMFVTSLLLLALFGAL